MTSDRWEQINKLYQSALGVSEDERRGFVEQACVGDEPMRREVEMLLEAHARAEGFLMNPAQEETARGLSRDIPVLQSGRRLGPYEVLQFLGAGGMGEVYKARDTRLDRTVAIKILPNHLSERIDLRQRFELEARTIARLNHPNICALYDIGREDGIDFLVMEYVEGETLAQRLIEGALPTALLLRMAIEITTVLEQAHRHGITHRDLKPGNIMLTKMGVKLLDFGLAKYSGGARAPHTLTNACGSARSTPSESLTGKGAVLGTLDYMSPEQLLGKPTDARSDLWALGVVLYEMAAGERPFQGQTGFELSSAILNHPPRPFPARVPTELRALIERCLEKEPCHRYQQAGEARAALQAIRDRTVSCWLTWRYRLLHRRWLVWAPTMAILLLIAVAFSLDWLQTGFWGGMPRVQSLAVLPLENLSRDPEQEYFADGMTEELITNLGKISALRVISRTSVMRYKETKKPLPEIAKELNVDAVIEGSVQRSETRVRITANLLHAASDRHLWAESYERDLRDVLSIQEEVARSIASEIRIKLTPDERTRLSGAQARPVKPKAFELYLKGRYHYSQWTPDGFRKAIEYYRKAIEADPDWAPAYAGLATSYGWLWIEGAIPPQEALPQFEAALKTALAIDESIPEVRYTLAASAFYYRWDWGEAEREFKRALVLDPNLVEARFEYAWFLSCMGRIPEALVEAQRAVDRDPLSVSPNLALGSVLFLAHQDDRAIAQLQRTVEMDLNDSRARGFLIGIYEQKQMYGEAIRELQKEMTTWGIPAEKMASLERTYQQSGPEGYRRWQLSEAQRRNSTYGIALAYAQLGNADQAVGWLEKSYQQHDWQMVQLKTRRAWEPIRSDARFQDLLRRMNFPP